MSEFDMPNCHIGPTAEQIARHREHCRECQAGPANTVLLDHAHRAMKELDEGD